MDFRPSTSTSELTSRVALETAVATDDTALIPLPRAGELVVIDLSGIEQARFAFDPNVAETAVRGDDLVLTINGGAIILVGYLESLRLDDLPLFVSPQGEPIFPDALLGRPGGQDPALSGKSDPEIIESGSGFTPFQDTPLFGVFGDPAGGLSGTSIDYTTSILTDSFLPFAFDTVQEIRPVPPPIAIDDSTVTEEDAPVTIAVLSNDTANDGSDLRVEAAEADNGTVVINSDNTLTYTPAPDFNGTDTITYSVKDGHGGTATAIVTVTVNPVQDAPIAADDVAVTGEDIAVSASVLGNDSDADGDKLTHRFVAGLFASVAIGLLETGDR